VQEAQLPLERRQTPGHGCTRINAACASPLPSAAGGTGPCLPHLCAARGGKASEEAVASASGRLFQGPVGSPLTSRVRQRRPAGRLVLCAQGEEGSLDHATDREKEDWMKRQVRTLQALTPSAAVQPQARDGRDALTLPALSFRACQCLCRVVFVSVAAASCSFYLLFCLCCADCAVLHCSKRAEGVAEEGSGESGGGP